MSKRHFLFVALLLSFTLTAQKRGVDPQDAIREVIQEAYVDGLFNEGNVKLVRLGIHPDFKMRYLNDEGILVQLSRDQWLSKVRAKKAAGGYPPPPTEQVRVDFVRVDVEGELAQVKLKFYIGNQLRYIDFLSLHAFPTGWMITDKTFHELPRGQK